MSKNSGWMRITAGGGRSQQKDYELFRCFEHVKVSLCQVIGLIARTTVIFPMGEILVTMSFAYFFADKYFAFFCSEKQLICNLNFGFARGQKVKWKTYIFVQN